MRLDLEDLRIRASLQIVGSGDMRRAKLVLEYPAEDRYHELGSTALAEMIRPRAKGAGDE